MSKSGTLSAGRPSATRNKAATLASLADEAETFAQRQLALRAMLAVRTASAPRGAPLAP